MADQGRRLDMLVRQGLMPAQNLPILKRAIARVQMGSQLLPNEREIIKRFMDELMFIVFGDDTVFNRAKQNTQRNRYQTEEHIVSQLDEKMVDGVEVVDGDEERMKDEVKAKKLGKMAKKDKMKMFAKSLRKEKEKEEQQETLDITNLNKLYQDKFNEALEEFGVSTIRDLPESKKKEFFACIDEKMAKKDHDGDGKIETKKQEYFGSRDKAIKKAMAKEEVEQADEAVRVKDTFGTHPTEKDKPGSKPHPHTSALRRSAADIVRGYRNDPKNKKDGKVDYKNLQKKTGFKLKKEEVDLDEEGKMAKDKESHDTGGFRISDKEAKAAKNRVKLRGFPDGNGGRVKGNIGSSVARSHLMKNSVEYDFNEEELLEYITAKQIRMARGIANDPRHKGGDYTGAAKKMEKIKKGLSNHPAAQKALRQANESLEDIDASDLIENPLVAAAARALGAGAARKAGMGTTGQFAAGQVAKAGAKKVMSSSNSQQNEEMTPEQKAKRLEMIRQIAIKVRKRKEAQAERDAERAAKRDMSRPGAQKGMAPVKKEEIDLLKDIIKGELSETAIGVNRYEAFSILNQILKQNR